MTTRGGEGSTNHTGRGHSGGAMVAEALLRHGVPFVFTLCGGHISPILVESQRRGIRVVDVRDEASAAFAADAVSRLTGVPGVAAVTAGPGVTNTITAIKNAELAQSPLVLLGGATGTILKGRGSLQDIDQEALMAPHVKAYWAATRVRDLPEAVNEALAECQRGVPGPVFVECPVDLLYEEDLVRDMYGVGKDAPEPRSTAERLQQWYLRRHLGRLFAGKDRVRQPEPARDAVLEPSKAELRSVRKELLASSRPVVLVGSQALQRAGESDAIAEALRRTGLPVYLSGMARGLLGGDSEQQLRHQRRKALKDADLVLLLGVPCDFRLDYGRQLGKRTRLVSVNLSPDDLVRNRKPQVGVVADPGRLLQALAAGEEMPVQRWAPWLQSLRARDQERETDIGKRAGSETEGGINPLVLCRGIDAALDDDSVLVADGGDFVATAAYTVRPRGPLRWLDPGPFGTLGVGGGFAMGAKLARPSAEVWLLWGDGSSAFSLAEFDTFVRHELPVIAVVGNDASWMQIAREQVEILGDACATELRRTDYHRVAEGYGGKGLLLEHAEQIPEILAEAKAAARAGQPVLVNALLGRTDFRKGSISM